MMEVLEKGQKTLLEDYDYEQKVRHMSLKKRIEWFVDNKKQMSQMRTLKTEVGKVS